MSGPSTGSGTGAGSGIAVGDVVAERTVHLTRESLVRYAGASGDFNPIHYRDDIAASVGLPGVLAHGMLTMGLAVETIVPWLGDAGRILEYGVRFTRPVVVDPQAGADVTIVAKAGVASRPVSIFRRVSGEMSAARATSVSVLLPRASRSRPPRRLPAASCSGVKGSRTMTRSLTASV